jgi:WD40 repeat protein/serine/threonine protein kinase
MTKIDEPAIFDIARLIKAPEARRLYIEQACAEDRDLLARVEALLRMYDEEGDFLETTAEGVRDTLKVSIGEGVGSQIGPYKLIEQIGEGGFGVVFMAEQQQPIRRKVALKVLKPGMDTRQIVTRFEAERQALALMDHANIARVLDGGETTTGRPYFVMELVQGIPITQYCDEHQLTPRERLALFLPVCQAVQHAHQKGIIHRDLKPSNVLIAAYDGRPVPKVIDFGVAKALGQQLTERTLLTGFGGIIGTLEYMSPEQAEFNAHDVDTRADIYSLGVLLYEILTGTTPLTKHRLKEAEMTEALRLIREEEPPKPSSRLRGSKDSLASISALRKLEPAKLTKEVRGELDWIVMKALEKDRSRRYETADRLARDIESYLNDEPVEAGPPSARYRLRKFARKNRKLLGLVAAFALLMTAGTVASLWQAVRATQAEQTASQERDRAEAEAKRSHRNLYDAHLRLAQSAWEEARVKRVRELLEQYRPAGGDEDLRGFEWHYLHRLTDSALLTFTGHTKLVGSVVFSPDGTRLATASEDGTVKVWDAANGRVIRNLEGHKGFVVNVAFSPDGKQLASASFDRTVKLWDVASGRNIRDLDRANSVGSVAFSPDGTQLATGSYDGFVKLWNTSSGKESQHFKAHSVLVASVAFSPDGKSIATGGWDKLVKVWDLASGKERLRLEGHTGELKSVAFSPDGKLLASAGLDRTVRIWDVASPWIWDLVRPRMIHRLIGHTDRIFSVAFSPDGKRVASAGVDQTVRVWDVATGDEAMTLKGHTSWVSSVAFSPDGKRLASAGHDQTVKLWDATSGGETMMVIRAPNLLKSVAFSPDGKRLASSSDDWKVKVWDAASGLETQTLIGHTDSVWSIAFSPDGKRLASAGADSTVRVWDAMSGQEIGKLKGPTKLVFSVAFSPDGKRLAAGSMDETVTVWDLSPGPSPTSGGERGGVHEPITLHGHSESVLSVAFSPDGKWLASASHDGTIKLWDSMSGQLIRTFLGHSRAVNCVVFSPEGNRLASASADATVRIWGATSGQQMQRLEGHTFDVNCVVFSPDGKRLASAAASVDKTVKVWDTISGQETLTFKGHNLGFPGVAFSPDGQRLAAASFDGTVRVWDARPWTPQLRVEQEARNLINLLYSKVGSKAEVIRIIQKDTALAAEVREEALEMAKRWQPAIAPR